MHRFVKQNNRYYWKMPSFAYKLFVFAICIDHLPSSDHSHLYMFDKTRESMKNQVST